MVSETNEDEVNGAWKDGTGEFEEIDDLDEVSYQEFDGGYDPPLEVAPAAYTGAPLRVGEERAETELLIAPADIAPFGEPMLEESVPTLEAPASAGVTVPSPAPVAAPTPVPAVPEGFPTPVPGSSPFKPAFDAAVRDAMQAPDNDEHWNKLEELGKNLNRADDVAEVYREVLNQALARKLALDLMTRAIRFHDEWLDEPEEVSALLKRVLEIEPGAQWAFDRISLNLTVEARWDELLVLYDSVLDATEDEETRGRLLDEAAAIAKDCAGAPERAVDYLLQVYSIRRSDQRTGAALERLLKQQQRYRELIDFWTMRLEVVTGREALTTRQQIASCLLEDLSDPNGALAAVELLLDDPQTVSTATNLLEMILGSPASTADVRARALERLSEKCDGTKRWRQVVHALEIALTHAPEDEHAQIHSEITRRLVHHNAHDEALGHLAALVAIAPDTWDDARLEELLQGTFNGEVAGCKPSIDRERGRKLVHLAAERSSKLDELGERAIALYRKLIEDKPDDFKAIERLSKLYSDAERTEDLLALRQHELEFVRDIDKRLQLRLQIAEIAGLFGTVNDEDGAIRALRDNLDERPDHEPTLDALIERLKARGQHEALADLLTEQASNVEKLERNDLAARLWMLAAGASRTYLFDLERAVDCYQRVVELEPNVEALDELATVFIDREEHAQAIGWLKMRLELSAEGHRTPIVVRLARAYIDSNQHSDALACLQEGLREDPSSMEIRDQLAELHRHDGAWTELVDVLMDGATGSTDTSVRHKYLLEAAKGLQHGLHSPERAIPVLEQVMQIRPKDREVRVALADALRAAGRLDEAQTLANQLIEEYGRRHPPARARLHLLLAQVLRAQGRANEAINQLELGVTMDMGNLKLQHLLGKLYGETGQLQKAERAYHALTLLLRRRAASHRPLLADDDVGIAEALFELHLVAKDLGAYERAAENLESAFDAAAQDPMEASHFERILRATGDAELLLRSLERRLSLAESAQERSRIFADIASVQEEELDQPDRALASYISAIQESPESLELCERASALAQQTGELNDFADMLERVANGALAEGDARLGCKLLMQLGILQENDLRDFSKAATIYARAEETGHDLVKVWSARARIAAALDDEPVELAMLRKLVNEDAGAMQTSEHTEALYRLADLELTANETLAAGVRSLRRALSAEPRYEHAARLLQDALLLEPDAEEAILALESVGRAAFDDALLLDALARRAERPNVGQDILREAVEVANRLENTERKDMLLQRAVDIAVEDDGDLSKALWALQQLGTLREAQGDWRDAIHWMTEAANISGPEESRAHTMRVAEIAGGPLEDLEASAEAYEKILEHEPGEPTVWRPLLKVLRRMDDQERLEDILKKTINAVSDLQTRCELRIEHATLLRDAPDRKQEALELLEAVLEDDSDNPQAAELLADLLEELGRTSDLIDLLERQLSTSKERSDALLGARFALRLAEATKSDHPDRALQTYRDTLGWIPANALLFRGLLDLLDGESDAAERADVLEQLLKSDGLDDAITLALDLVDMRDRLEDREGLERALETAYAIEPGGQRVLDRYRELAEGLAGEANAMDPGDEPIEKLHRAASIYHEKLDDPAAAAVLISRAQEMRPEDLDILNQLVAALLASKQPQVAVDRVTVVMDGWPGDDARRAQLHRIRAHVWTSAGDFDSAVNDLEEARAFEGDAVLPDLYESLLQARAAADDRLDFDSQRSCAFRIYELLLEMKRPDQARNTIADWITDAPDDVEAICMLLEMDRASERWDEVSQGCIRLVNLEVGPARAEAALKHAEACEKLGHIEESRESLERVFRDDPAHDGVRAKLRTLYERLQEYRELSALMLVDANHAEEENARFELLREAGRMRLGAYEQAASAIGPLSEALEIRPNDLEVTLLLADAYISAGLIGETVQLLQAGIDRQGGRRSRELAALQHRMARAAATSDRNNEMQWLLAAFESFPQGTDVASELAELAMELGQYEVALKALRALATAKSQGPISRPMAFLKQAQIAKIQGDDRKAAFLAKKAVFMDPGLTEAREFLEQISDG